MQCATCDTTNQDDVRFCVQCGAPTAPVTPSHLPTTRLEPAPAAAVQSPAPAALAPARPAAQLAPIGVSAAPTVPPIAINVVAQASAPAPAPVVIVAGAHGPGLFVRALYFIFFGAWLGAFWTGLAWALLASVVGLPLGLMMLNRLPQVMTLRSAPQRFQVATHNGVMVVSRQNAAQRSFAVRALYFVLVGWWASALWLGLAWGILAFTFGLGLPISFWMFDRTPAIVTLGRA